MEKQFRLKEEHPTFKKVQELWSLADKLGLTLQFESGVCVVEDKDQPDIKFFLEDIEPNHIVTGFPHETEFKLVYRKSETG